MSKKGRRFDLVFSISILASREEGKKHVVGKQAATFLLRDAFFPFFRGIYDDDDDEDELEWARYRDDAPGRRLMVSSHPWSTALVCRDSGRWGSFTVYQTEAEKNPSEEKKEILKPLQIAFYSEGLLLNRTEYKEDFSLSAFLLQFSILAG